MKINGININGMNIISEQNGGATEFGPESFDPSDTDQADFDLKFIYQKRRSYLVGVITEEVYQVLLPHLNSLRKGTGETTRSGALMVRLYKPGEPIVFDQELLTTEDYHYPNIIKAYSVEYTEDIFDPTENIDSYRIVAIDMIWCREDTLFERLIKLVNLIPTKVSKYRGVYTKYIYKVLKQLHPDLGISKKAMFVVDSHVQDLFLRIAEEASRLARYTYRKEITEREIAVATRLVLPEMLANHATREGRCVLERYKQSNQ